MARWRRRGLVLVLVLGSSAALSAQTPPMIQPPYSSGYQAEMEAGRPRIVDYTHFQSPIGDQQSWYGRRLDLTRTVVVHGRLWYQDRWNGPMRPGTRPEDVLSSPCEVKAQVHLVEPADPKVLVNWGRSPEQLSSAFRYSSSWSTAEGGAFIAYKPSQTFLLGRLGRTICFIHVSIPGRPGHNASFFPDEGAAQSIGNRDALALWAAVRKAAGEDSKEEEEGSPPAAPPWKVAAGVAAAAAAIAAVAKTLASRRARKPTRPPQYGYVLQVSANVVEVEWGKPSSLTITAWQVDERGGHTLASDVPIEISTPDSALVIDPRSGTGKLVCQLSLDGQPRSRTLDLEIKARGGGQTITATVTAKIGLAVEIVVQWDPPAGRTYRGISFKSPSQLAADGEDALKAIVYVRVKGKVPEEITRSKIRPSIDPGDGDFELRIDPTFDEPDKVRVLIRSKGALLNTADPPPKVALRVEAKTVTRGGYDIDLPPVVVPLEARRVFLKLWVVPGGARHTSEARCYACLAPNSSAALTSFPLMLKVEALGSGHLTIDGPDMVETTRTGVAGWLLRYSGLTWENYLNARFTVRCGPAVGRTAPIQGTDAIIDVGANVTQLLEAIHDQQNSTLNLNNNCFTPSMLDIVIPNEMSGAYTNIRHEFGNTDWDEYICGNYSARIFEWMAMRRFGNSKSCDAAPFSVMNGIEVDQYAMWWVGPVSHHFAGFHLSGTGPLDDPRFIDPWWRQEWRDQSRRQLAGLQTRNTERFLLVASIGYVVALVSAVGALLGASAPFIAGVAKNLGGRLPAVDLAMGDVYEDAPANFNSGSLYARYWATWLNRTLDHLRTTHPTVPAVEHIHAW